MLSADPLKIYVHKDGLARFATEKYCGAKPDTFVRITIFTCNKIQDNLFMHLTNTALNKYNEKYIPNTEESKPNEGHKRSIESINQYLEKNGHDVKALWEQIHVIIHIFTSSIL